ncbi:MAG: zinc-dependent metalloprotease [Flavobacteriaceae bacterium]|nr:zinc-dependent metalloprotease [Flavobacteriaceae bacterium]
MKSLMLKILFFTSYALISQELKKEPPIDSLLNEMKMSKGFITTYLNENKLYLEIKKEVLGKELLMVTRFSKFPANYSKYINAGSKTAENIISFELIGKKIAVKKLAYTNKADIKDPINKSVIINNFPPILAVFKIISENSDNYLIDVSKYFMDNSPGFNLLTKGDKQKYKIGAVDKKRSFIDSAKAFVKNIEIRHTLTFNASNLPRSNNSQTLTFQINHSIISLPENPMMVRYEDKRIGWFSLNKVNYSSNELKSDEYNIITKWRLEPKDIDAYNRGELVDPIKPIVYFLDPATPIKWRPYIKKGIEDWNIAFKRAGFKNAIIAKDPPPENINPDFNPEDISFSTVRYVASKTRNAVGPRVSDPRTGEILESDIIWYHNHLRSYRNRYLIETGAANPKARTLNTPESEIGEMMRRVISHEVGHALGLPHNMKASSAYPVDSLRSGNFTQKMGIASTIMDYARYNYVAQPGDKDIRFIRKLGPYDEYSIEWGYRYFDKKNESEVDSILSKWIDNKNLNPKYMYGYGGQDPNTQTEDIGNDPVKASYYGLKNLKIVAKNLEKWTTKNGSNYDDLKELYQELIGVYRRYIYHVVKLIGGVNELILNQGQDGIPYLRVNKEKQLEAIKFLNQNLWESPSWLYEKNLISKINNQGVLKLISNLQRSVFNRIFNSRNLNPMISSQYTLAGNGLDVNDLLDRVFEDLTLKIDKPDILKREIQKNMISQINLLINDEDLLPEIRGLLIDKRRSLRKYFKSKRKSNNEIQRIHYEYCYNKLKNE